jgi:hypothetical protein
MCVDCFFLRIEEKTMPLHGRRRCSLPTRPLRACTASSPGPMKNWPLPWSTEEDARGWRTGATPLRHCGTSLSWRGRRTALRKTNGDVAAGPPPCRTSPRVAGHTCDGDELRRRRGRQKPEKGIEGGRRGIAFIKKVRMHKWYDD